MPGCGSGHDVRALTTRENHVMGVDLAPFAITKAKARPKIAHEEYMLADLFDLPAKLDRPASTGFSSTPAFARSIRPGGEEYVAAIVRLLKPQGRLLAIFFINPDHDEDGPPYRVSTAELDEFFGNDFSIEREWVPKRTHPGREERELMRVLARSEGRASARPAP